ncbi:organomercurial lyase [Deinococcus budaensis]|uniref:organomercurial lyase n=1 Tax=Deinococcus budaensis TaxID=1665626 RepID=UPI001FE5FF3A|nr:organomercurial lyase [Deinococcus budaensis]
MFTPTPHVVHTAGGVRIFTRCALDTLLAAWILNGNIDIATTPPGEAQPLHLTVRDGHLQAPPDAVLAVPTQPDVQKAEGIHRSFLPYAPVWR